MATLIFILIVTATISVEAGKLKYEDQAENIYNELFSMGRMFFADKTPDLPADEVHNKLVTLSQLYSTRTDKTLRKRKREVDDLIEARNIKPGKCDEGNFVDLANIMDDYRSIPRIQSYLIETKWMLFKICDVKYRNNLERDLNGLSREDMSDILKIYQYLMKGSLKEFVDFHDGKIPLAAIVEALVKYLINKPNPSFSLVELRDRTKPDHIFTHAFKSELRRVVFDVCENVKFSTQNTLSFYEQLLDDQDLKDQFDSWVLEWTTSKKICEEARDYFDTIQNKVLNLMLNRP